MGNVPHSKMARKTPNVRRASGLFSHIHASVCGSVDGVPAVDGVFAVDGVPAVVSSVERQKSGVCRLGTRYFLETKDDAFTDDNTVAPNFDTFALGW